MKKKKAIRGWALFENDHIACFDHRLPIYWLRAQANAEADERLVEKDVRRVTIVVEDSVAK